MDKSFPKHVHGDESSIDDLVELLQRLSLEDVCPWERLPAEIVQSIGEYAFLPSIEYRNSPISLYPVDPRPDLAFMGINRQCKDILEQKIIPESVIVVIQHHICGLCMISYEQRFGNGAPLLQIFRNANTQPWISMLKGGSVISMRVRCSRRTCPRLPTSSIATFYYPRKSLNLIAISQLIEIDCGVTCKKTIDIQCTPQSLKGAQHSVRFLRSFAKLVHGMKHANVSVDRGSLQLPNSLLPGGLKSLTDPMRRKQRSWNDGASTRDVLFAEVQNLLDEEKVPLYQIAIIANHTLDGMMKRYPIPTAEAFTQKVADNDLYEFMVSKIHAGCMKFLIFNGLTEYTAQQLNGQPVPKHPLMTDSGVASLIGRLDLQHQHLLRQCRGNERFMEWQVDDLPYLIHYVVMLQCSIRFHVFRNIMSHHSTYSSEHAITILRTMPYGYHYLLLKEQLDYLSYLSEQIAIFGGHTDLVTLARFDDYGIPEFIKSARKLLDKIDSLSGRKMTEFENHEVSALLYPKAPRIPVVHDWGSVLTTFRRLNQSKLFWDWWIDW